MKCVGCNKGLLEEEVKFFLKVLLCQSCALQAEKFRNRARSELENLLVTLDPTIQMALSEKQSSSICSNGSILLSNAEVISHVISLNKSFRHADK